MKKYYADVTEYASENHKGALVDAIDPTQKGNESQFAGDLDHFPVDQEKVEQNANLIGAGLFQA